MHAIIHIVMQSNFCVCQSLIFAFALTSSGKLRELCSGKSTFCVSIEQTWGYYTSFHSFHHQNSGAYIFRPHKPDDDLHILPHCCSNTTSYISDLVSEVHTKVSSWLTQITRIKKNAPYLEMQYIVGPVPDEDCIGKEVVTRYTSKHLQNNGIFYTDSNGREFMKRQKGTRSTWDFVEHQPIAGNYYPVIAAMYIHDDVSSLTVLNDRSQGGTSLSDGTIELMVHRRTKYDDHRGVEEPIDETDGGMSPYPPYGDAKRHGKGIIIQGIHRLMVGSGHDGAENARSQMDGTFSPLHLFFATAPSSATNAVFEKASFSALQSDLPSNIMLMTFKKVRSSNVPSSTKAFLVRIGHQYAIGEGKEDLSSPVLIDMRVLFPNQRILSMMEKTLSNNQNRDSWERKRFQWKAAPASTNDVSESTKCATGDGTTIVVRPMKICTFEIVTTGELPNSDSSSDSVEAQE